MDTFEIDVRPGSGNSWPVVTTFSPAGVLLPLLAKGMLALSAEDLEELTSLLGKPQEYGAWLGRALFRDEVRDAFTRALARSEDRLRVLLSIEADDPELKVLHWERLCAPIDGWASLAIHQRTPFSLYIPSLTERRFPPIGPLDLRALVLVASPKEAGRYRLAPFDAAGTVAGLKEALDTARIPCDVLARTEGAAGAPTLDRLCARLTDRNQRYTLLHIVCHGKLIEGGETVLYWEDEDGGAQPVTATELIGRLRHVEGPRGLPHFTFLSTCESASPLAQQALGGLGTTAGARPRHAGGGGYDRPDHDQDGPGAGRGILSAARPLRRGRHGAARGSRDAGAARRHLRAGAVQPPRRTATVQRSAGPGVDQRRDPARPGGVRWSAGRAGAGAGGEV